MKTIIKRQNHNTNHINRSPLFDILDNADKSKSIDPRIFEFPDDIIIGWYLLIGENEKGVEYWFNTKTNHSFKGRAYRNVKHISK